MSKFEVINKGGGLAEITLYDTIDRFYGISAASIYDQLKELGDIKQIRARINSSGGSVFEGIAIYNILKHHSARVTISIDGLAASMASVIAMAGDSIEIGDGAYMMIHDPLGDVKGNAEEMRDMADLLDKMRDQLIGIYARRTSQTNDQIMEWMKNETWMTADEAIANGFADRSTAGLKIAAFAPLGLFENPPPALLAERQPQGAKPMSDTTTPQAATWAELKACCPGADAEFLGKQLDANATAQAATTAWMNELQLRAEIAAEEKAKADAARAEAEKQAEEARAEAEKAKAAKPGVSVLGGGKSKATGEGNAIEDFCAAVDAKVKAGLNRTKATAAVVRDNPELHAEYIAAVNAR